MISPRIKIQFAVAAAVATLTTAPSALASEAALAIHGLHPQDGRGIIGHDNRETMSRNSRLGKKIVRVLDQNRSWMCTGSVVGPQLVLTAAHCTFKNGRWLTAPNDREPTFVEAWNGDIFDIVNISRPTDFRGTRRVTSDGAQGMPIRELKRDTALLWVNKNISEVSDGLLTLAPESVIGERENVLLIGYHEDVERRRFQRLVSQSCEADFRYYVPIPPFVIVENIPLDRVRHFCDTASGSSGAPLLVDIGGGRMAIAAVNVASGYGWWHDRFNEVKGNTATSVNEQGWLKNTIREHLELHGYRLENGIVQSPDDVDWLKS